MLMDERGEGVVESAAGVVFEIEHGDAVFITIVEADGAAVAIPEGVARANDEADAVVAEVEAFKGADDFGGVGGFLHTHPGFGVTALDAVHEAEGDTSERAVGVHDAAVGAVGVHGDPTAGGVILEVFCHACDNGVGRVLADAEVGVGEVGIVGGDDDGLHLFPLAGEPDAVVGQGFAVFGLRGNLAGGDVGESCLGIDSALVVHLSPLAHHLILGSGVLSHCGDAHKESCQSEKNFFHRRWMLKCLLCYNKCFCCLTSVWQKGGSALSAGPKWELPERVESQA